MLKELKIHGQKKRKKNTEKKMALRGKGFGGRGWGLACMSDKKEGKSTGTEKYNADIFWSCDKLRKIYDPASMRLFTGGE